MKNQGDENSHNCSGDMVFGALERVVSHSISSPNMVLLPTNFLTRTRGVFMGTLLADLRFRKGPPSHRSRAQLPTYSSKVILQFPRSPQIQRARADEEGCSALTGDANKARI